MSFDFTLTKYRELCRAMKTREVLTFRDYVTRQDLPEKYVILRHDPPPRPPKSPLNQRFLSRRDFAARFFQRGLTPKNMVLMMKPNIPSGLNFD